MTATDALRRQPTAAQQAVPLQRLAGVRRATGVEPATRAEPRTQYQLVRPDERAQRQRRQMVHAVHARAHFCSALRHMLSSCVRSRVLPCAAASDLATTT